jgi:hypothetical protein
MKTDEIKLLMTYNDWCDARLLEACAAVSRALPALSPAASRALPAPPPRAHAAVLGGGGSPETPQTRPHVPGESRTRIVR